jgi:glycine/D-amino acid oxidase-like deaminating enzyme
MGLSTALTLAEKGVSVAVLEAAEIGWGASGRNNGLVAPGLKRDPWQVRKILGTESGDRLLRFANDAPDVVFKLIDELAIDCDLNRGGWIQAAHSKRAMPLIEKRVAQWQALGIAVDTIPADNVSAELGTDFYAGASRYARGGSINPLAFVYGLAAAASVSGAKIYEQSPSVGVRREDGKWVVASAHGSVRCEQLVCCTNAYNDNIDKLRGTVIPLRTAQVASHPLPRNVAASILPRAAAASDTQRLLTSFRLTADNRLIMGGASATAGDHHLGLVKHLHKAARLRFPNIDNISWDIGWSGYLALTTDHLPQILRVEDDYYAGIGCNGRGIGMATATGRSIAELICGQDEKDCSVPIRKPKRVFGYGMRRPGVAVGVLFNRFLDTVERLT